MAALRLPEAVPRQSAAILGELGRSRGGIGTFWTEENAGAEGAGLTFGVPRPAFDVHRRRCWSLVSGLWFSRQRPDATRVPPPPFAICPARSARVGQEVFCLTRRGARATGEPPAGRRRTAVQAGHPGARWGRPGTFPLGRFFTSGTPAGCAALAPTAPTIAAVAAERPRH